MSVLKRWQCLMICVFVAGAVSVSFSADVKSSGDGSIKPGETRVRTTNPADPPPYFATAPIAISVAPKFEAPGEDWDVVMLRLNLLVGSHRAVYALDVGALANLADYKMDGIGVAGLFNAVGSSDGAIHVAGIFNHAAYDFSGCQISGILSLTEGSHRGLQIGLGNYAGKIVGAQIGAFNYAERLVGAQIGLVNINGGPGAPFLPIVNLAF